MTLGQRNGAQAGSRTRLELLELMLPVVREVCQREGMPGIVTVCRWHPAP